MCFVFDVVSSGADSAAILQVEDQARAMESLEKENLLLKTMLGEMKPPMQSLQGPPAPPQPAATQPQAAQQITIAAPLQAQAASGS